MSTPTRILFITAFLDVGGTERHLLWLLPELKQAGFDVSLFALKPGGTLTEDFRRAGIEVLESSRSEDNLAGLIGTASSLVGHLLSERYDIVHYFLPAAYSIGGASTLLTSGRCLPA